MKKIKSILAITFAFGTITSVYSQIAVTLHHLGTTQIFSGSQPFLNAYNAASAGDTIYLPGFNFSNAQPSSIDKEIHLIGTGHFPDSTQATGRTILSGLNIKDGADKSHFEGIYFTGSLSFETDNAVDSVIIKRNRIDGTVAFNSSVGNNKCKGVEIYDNSIGNSIDCNNAEAINIHNNILSSGSYYVGTVMNARLNSHIHNNVMFVYYYSSAIYNSEYCLVENNIMIPIHGSCANYSGTNYCTFKNNILIGDPTGDTYHTWTNNYVNLSAASLINHFNSYGLDNLNNYHLVNPLTYLGSDGTETGIYGGASPYKEGAITSNPHIQSKSIANQTDVNGNLNVNIKVSAQDK